MIYIAPDPPPDVVDGFEIETIDSRIEQYRNNWMLKQQEYQMQLQDPNYQYGSIPPVVMVPANGEQQYVIQNFEKPPDLQRLEPKYIFFPLLIQTIIALVSVFFPLIGIFVYCCFRNSHPRFAKIAIISTIISIILHIILIVYLINFINYLECSQ